MNVTASSPDAYLNLAVALEQAGQSIEALRALERAVQLDPKSAGTGLAFADGLWRHGRIEYSLAVYRRVAELHPSCAAAHHGFGTAAKALGRLDEATAAFEATLRIDPTRAGTYSNLAGVYEWQARHDDALAAHRRAIALAPDAPGIHGSCLYTLLFHPGFDDAALRREHVEWDERHARPWRHRAAPHHNDRSPERRLRIGYVSGLFRNHVLGQYLLPLLREHDPADVDVICYSSGKGDDAMTRRFREIAAGWRDIGALSEEAAAEQIREDQVDILVDTPLHMESKLLLIFARKPAPVQVAFAGYPGTTGMPAIDYRLTDAHLDPPGGNDAAYVEASWRLPHTFWCHDTLGVTTPVGDLPAARNGRVTFGCLNNFAKTNERVLALWARVLRAVPNSRLLLLAHCGWACLW